MKKYDIEKIKLNTEIEVLNNIINKLEEFKQAINIYEGKAWRNPLKTQIFEEFKQIYNTLDLKYRSYLTSSNSINIYYDDDNIKYYNIVNIIYDDDFYRIAAKKDIHEYLIYYASSYEYIKKSIQFNYNIDFDKKININVIDVLIDKINEEIKEKKERLLNYDSIVLKVIDACKKLKDIANDLDNIDYYYIGQVLGDDLYKKVPNKHNYEKIIDLKIDDFYFDKEKTINILNNLLKNSNFKKYNSLLDNIIINNNSIDIIYKNGLINIDIETYQIEENFKKIDYDFFDKRIDDEHASSIKACMKIRNLVNKSIIEEIDNIRDEFAFTSTSDLTGYYMPNKEININVNNVYYSFVCVAFRDSKAYAVFENEKGDIFLY